MARKCVKQGCDKPVFGGNYCLWHQGYRTDKKKPEGKPHRPVRVDPMDDLRKKLVNELDAAFSLYIRVKYSYGGICHCYTCLEGHKIADIDCGHFISRGHRATRWHVNNARPQCRRCNRENGGERDKFRERLIRDIGQDQVSMVEHEGRNICSFSVAEMLALKQNFITETKIMLNAAI